VLISNGELLLVKLKLFIIVVLLLLTLAATYFLWPREKIDFNSQVKPILNKKCITCHGGVKREANFSLLFRQEALEVAESGKKAIVPGDADHSELVRRITESDPEERMPYKEEPLSKQEIKILTQWIEEGAVWGDHWAYVKVEKPEIPKASRWTRNEVDHFIAEKWEEQNLTPSPEASKEMLLRRVCLDLVGLPPAKGNANSFLTISTNNEYEKVVDSLLASPHFGERWASVWMDLARYADTKGYERDDSRSIWRYRDWLINAFNKDMPYNQFITEQLAGDLFPNPTDEQYIATAFHRNTMTNDEGGTDNEEFRTSAVLDRVNTTWEAMMGTTFACVQCHSHPYDPFRHEEYYKFVAFFNNTRDEDTYAEYPLLRHLDKTDSVELASLTNWVQKNISSEKAKEVNTFLKTWQPSINSIQADQFTNSELSDTKWLVFRNHASCRLQHVDLDKRNQLIYRWKSWKPNGIWTIHLDQPNGPILKVVNVKGTNGSWAIGTLDFPTGTGVHDLFFTYSNPNLKTPEDNGMMFDWFHFTTSGLEKDKNQYAKFWSLLTKEVPTTPIVVENTPSLFRPTQVFQRGNWLVKTDTVQPGVPQSLNPLPKDAPKNRLGLAQWMTSRENPLLARTIVNRVWEQIFGTGLAETLEDMGTQGIPPTHKELLDHLSSKLMNEYQWSLKRLIKEMVMSATYRQDSKVTPDQLAKDPFNKFYARASRVRLSAEQVRDQALSVTGLLSNKMFGPSVMPYQPEGIWLSPWNGENWTKSKSEDQYRRAVYTYWKRSAPYPSMMTFDGATREVCTARRIRTNTPLQALVTLNDSVYVEASYRLAQNMQQKGNEVKQQIAIGYEQAIGQKISSEKLAVLERLYKKAVSEYQGATQKLVSYNNQPDQQLPHTKALSLVANAILNLDEFVTKN
jgi:Protein of unknown function (DUF1553)/Protein of unknown function (DUF1549)/Planctomycete cytochrome C